MKVNRLSVPEVYHALVTTEEGLAESEALRRRTEFGANELAARRGTPACLRLLRQFGHFLAILLWVAAALSFLSEILHPGEGMQTLGLAILGVIVINGLFTFLQEERAERAVEQLGRLLPYTVAVLREGREKTVPARDIVPGDVVLLQEGDRVPADARVVESAGLRVNNAALTGESEPEFRSSEPHDGDILQSPNIVFAGSTVVAGRGRAVVYATGMRTEFGRIAHLTASVSPGLSPLQRETIRISRIVAVIATAMGILFFAIGQAMGRSFWENFLFAVGIIVANVPEGLLPTVTLALAMGSQRMARRRALIRNLNSVETLGSVTVICTDKTGTLTRNCMTVRRTALLGDDSSARRRLMTIALFCTAVRETADGLRGDPTDVALYTAGREALPDLPGARLQEFPFDPERKRMSVIVAAEGGRFILTKGAPENILAVCSRCLVNGADRDFGSEERRRVDDMAAAMMGEGLRVLAFAYRPCADGQDCRTVDDAEQDLVFAGLIGLADPPRPEVPDAIRRCRNAGIRVIMITGDAAPTARAIAREIGLGSGEPLVIEGHDLTRLSDADLRRALSQPDVLFARMTPKHKLRVVNALKELGERVAVTGDGVNDAPALKRADIGIAMGLTGTDVAKEAADMILLDDNFATIVNAVEEGRAVYENIRKFMSYILSSNVPEIVPYLASVLFRIPLPLPIIQILAVDLGTDILPALALGAEKPTPDLMQRPPRSRAERLLTGPLLARAYLFLGPLEAAAALFGFFLVLQSGGWHWGEMLAPADPLYLQATTACLTAIVVTQVANVFACRSSTQSVFSLGFFTNRLIFAGIAAELALQLCIVYTPWGNAVFGTAPLPAAVWLALVPCAVLLFGAEEARKAVAALRKRTAA